MTRRAASDGSTDLPYRNGVRMLTLRTARGRSLAPGRHGPRRTASTSPCSAGTAPPSLLVLYPLDGDEPLAEIALRSAHATAPAITGTSWSAGLPPAFRYGWRVDGPRGGGHRFDPDIVLLDPAATALSDGAVWGQVRRAETQRRHRPPQPLLPPALRLAARTPRR